MEKSREGEKLQRNTPVPEVSPGGLRGLAAVRVAASALDSRQTWQLVELNGYFGHNTLEGRGGASQPLCRNLTE